MALVREYRSEDEAAVKVCIVELQDFERRIDPKLRAGASMADEYFDWLIERCAQTAGKIFVAERRGAVAGFVSVFARIESDPVEEVPYEYAHINDVVVLPDYRGEGLGHSLLRKAEDYAREQGVTLVKIAVLAQNRNALALYEDTGFGAQELTLQKIL